MTSAAASASPAVSQRAEAVFTPEKSNLDSEGASTSVSLPTGTPTVCNLSFLIPIGNHSYCLTLFMQKASKTSDNLIGFVIHVCRFNEVLI